MADVPTFYAVAPPRCSMPIFDPGFHFCGSPAAWMRPGKPFELPAFFCHRHVQPSDVPIAGELTIRRVVLVAELVFTAVTHVPELAQAEAVVRLERALEAAGGLINLSCVTSTVGRWTVPRPAEQGKGVRGKG